MAAPAVVFHPEAVEESRAAYEWYAERSGLAASAFLAELDAAVDQIGCSPAAWPAYTAGTRRFLLRRFPFFVVLVLAVAHARRRPGYWRRRPDA